MTQAVFKKEEALGEAGALEVLNGPAKGKLEVLSFGTIHIGRAPDNDIVIEDKSVSRHHAQITFEDGHYFVADLNTSNGTLVNKKRILNQKIEHGDIVQVGHMIFRLLYPSTPGQMSDYVGIQNATQNAETILEKKSIRPLFYILFGIIALLVLWLWMTSKTPPSPMKQELERSTANTSATEEDISKPGPEAFSINWEKANQFYLSGYREYSAQNYLRALDDFKAALELYPDHRLAKIYLKKTEDGITQETDQSYKSALNYFNSGQYALAIYTFQSVMSLLKHRQPPEGFCQARQENRAPIENPDFEKYCDSEQKISEAQTKMSGEIQ